MMINHDARKIKLTLKFSICFPKRNDKEIRLASEQLENGKNNIKVTAPAGRYFHLEYQEIVATLGK